MKEKFMTRWFIDLELFLRWRFEERADMNIWGEPLLGWKDSWWVETFGKQYLTVLRDIKRLDSYEVKILKHHE